MLTLVDDVLEPLHLRSNEFVIVLRPVLGLTAYLDDERFWAREGAQRMLESFLAAVPKQRLGFFTTSLVRRWQRVSDIDALVQELSATRLVLDRPRHLFSFTIADFPNAPELGFHYTEIDDQRSDRAAVIELTLPFHSAPEELLQLALQLANLGAVSSMVGGYAVRWHRGQQRLAFDHFYLWAQRFVGLDAQDHQEAALTAHEHLHGTNWLTLVSAELAERNGVDLEALVAPPPNASTRVMRTASGALFVAGAQPVIGDLNQLEFPNDYSAVARRLEPLLPKAPVRFWGAFFEGDRSLLWQRRLIEPKGWPLQ